MKKLGILMLVITLLTGILLPNSIAFAEEINLLTNPGFEDELLGWHGYGECMSTVVSESPNSGSGCAYITERGQNWMGIGQNVLELVMPGNSYNISAWVKLAGTGTDTIKMTMRRKDGGQNYFDSIAQTVVPAGEWFRISGPYNVPETDVTELELYVEEPKVGSSFYVNVRLLRTERHKSEREKTIELEQGSGTATFTFTTDGTPVESFIYGDFDGNSVFNSIDFGHMRIYLLGITPPLTTDQERACDVNADGRANSIDFGYMRQRLLGIIQKFPAEI